MKGNTLLHAVFVFIQIQWVVSLLDPITLGLVGVGIGLLTYGYNNINLDKCKSQECCDQKWIPMKITGLDYELRRKLHGQHIAHTTVVSAMQGYARAANPPKALTMSFHGLPGSGKNFVASIIADSFFLNGTRSQYYHFFNGRIYAPDDRQLQYYQEQIKDTIVRSLLKCEKSMFVFDEVDMMPEGLLNVLVPFLDYVQETSTDFEGKRVRVPTNKAIYIFLSNTGSLQIMQQMMKFWLEGGDRNSRTLKDFENLVAIGAFNEKGGFQRSDTIRTNLIDHYVPFLPLEEEHVKRCMNDAFKNRMAEEINEATAEEENYIQFPRSPSREMEEEVLSVVTYGPEPHNIYAKSGCKKIEQKVISVLYQSRHFDY